MKLFKKITKRHILILSAFIINFFIVFSPNYLCPWKRYGIECAGCGATRMLKSILKLEFYQAFRYNPLVFIILILGIIYAIYIFICIILKKKYVLPNKKALIALAIIVVIYMVLRNIELFSFLKPTEIN